MEDAVERLQSITPPRASLTSLELALNLAIDELAEVEDWLEDRADYDTDVEGGVVHFQGNDEADLARTVRRVRDSLRRCAKAASDVRAKESQR